MSLESRHGLSQNQYQIWTNTNSSEAGVCENQKRTTKRGHQGEFAFSSGCTGFEPGYAATFFYLCGPSSRLCGAVFSCVYVHTLSQVLTPLAGLRKKLFRVYLCTSVVEETRVSFSSLFPLPRLAFPTQVGGNPGSVAMRKISKRCRIPTHFHHCTERDEECNAPPYTHDIVRFRPRAPRFYFQWDSTHKKISCKVRV